MYVGMDKDGVLRILPETGGECYALRVLMEKGMWVEMRKEPNHSLPKMILTPCDYEEEKEDDK
jgi:hypothetical protein